LGTFRKKLGWGSIPLERNLKKEPGPRIYRRIFPWNLVPFPIGGHLVGNGGFGFPKTFLPLVKKPGILGKGPGP